MDLEQIKYLPDDMKERYSKLERLFDSPGWALIEEIAKTRVSELETRQLNALNWDSALICRGGALAYAELVTLRERTEQEFAAIARQEEERQLLQIEEEYE